MPSRAARLERARPHVETPEPEPAEREPPAPTVLDAGNHAVAGLLARFRAGEAAGALIGGIETGVEALGRIAEGRIRRSVGRGGKNDPADVAVVRSLLSAAGFGDSDLDSAIERYQREKLGWSHGDGRCDPEGKTIRALRADGGAGGGADGQHGEGGAHADAAGSSAPASAETGPAAAEQASAPSAPMAAHEEAPATPAETPAAGAHESTPAAAEHQATAAAASSAPTAPAVDASGDPNEQAFLNFAAAREPLFAAMNGASDDEARRTAMHELRAYDAKHLPELRALQKAMGGRWDIKDPAARDAVLAAIQLEAATDAMGDLLADNQTVHKRVADASGMPLSSAWCGMFTVDHYRHSGMDKDLAAGFLHVDNVHDYFTYRHSRNPRRIPKWIWVDHQWHDLRSFHEERGALREWLLGEDVWKGGNLDIRPGDTALIDHQGDGKADHIVKVQSYDAATSTLLTIGGNDAGFVIDRHPKANRKVSANQERAETAAGGEALGKEGWHGEYGAGGGHVGLSVHKVTPDGKKRGTIFGVGRPSLVDFEEHPYDHGNNLKKPPPPLKE